MGLLLLFAVALLALLVVGIAAGAGTGTAVSHPDFAPMQRGIDDGTLGAPMWTGYAVGLLVVGMMWVALLIGFRPGHWIRIAVILWGAWYVFAFMALMRSYSGYALGETVLFGGFTAPSAWLVYGMGLSPWVLLFLVTGTFKQAYFGPDEQTRFEEILATTGRDAAPEPTDASRQIVASQQTVASRRADASQHADASGDA